MDRNIDIENRLKKLIAEHRCQHSRLIQKREEYRDILEYIIARTPKLNDPFYKLSTRIVWVLEGYDDFPVCKTCGKSLVHKNVNVPFGYRMFCNKKCANGHEESKRKGKETRYKLNNGKYFSEEIKQKVKNTTFQRYGVYNSMQAESVKNKMKANLEKKYGKGITNTFQIKKYKDKSKRTKLDRYGDENYNNSEKLKETIKNFSEEKKRLKRQRMDATNLKKYGVKHPMKNHAIFVKSTQKYLYDGIQFASKPEIAYYIWLKDNNINFEYQPNRWFDFTVEGKDHRYFPDFYLVDEDRFIEIKGLQFFENKDPNGRMRDPFGTYSREFMYAKQDCMKANNVQILTEIDYKPYINYIKQKYGTHFLDSLRKKR